MAEFPAGEPAPPPPPPPAAEGVPERRAPFPGFGAALLLVVLIHVIANMIAGLVYAARFASGTPLEEVLAMDASELGIITNSVAFGLVILLALRKSGERAADVFSFAPVPPVHWFPMALAFGGGLLVITEIQNLVLRVLPVPDWVEALFGSVLRGWFAPVFLVLVAPVTEELLFRGVFLRSFLPRYGQTRAILWSAALFGVIHLLPWQIVPAFLLGLLFAWWTIGTGSLWPALVGHALTNGMSYLQSRSLDPAEVFTATPQPFLWTVAGFLSLAAGVSLSSRLFRRDAGGDLPERSVS